MYDIPQHQTDPINGLYRAAVLLVFGVVLTFWIATEVTARRFGFQAALGAPFVPPHVYLPWDGLVWAFRFRAMRDANVHGIFFGQSLIIMAGLVLTLAGAIYVAVRTWRRTQRHSDLHGSAHWADAKEVAATGLLGGGGVYVGAWTDDRGQVRYLRDDGPSHVLAFAPTRSGKGVGLVIPTLLSWPHSTVVHDIKGENFALTAGWRERELGSRVLRFDPTALDGSARFNPLAEIRIGTEYETRDVQNVVQIITDPDGRGSQGEEAHWIATSSAFLLGVILHVLYFERDKSLAGVAGLLSNPAFEDARQLYAFLLTAEHDPSLSMGWRDIDGVPTSTHPVVAMAARDMLNRDPKEATSVLSTAIRFLTLWRDPIVARNTATSDFRLHDLMNGDRPMSLYLVVPPSDIDRLKPLTRLIINQILRSNTADMQFADGRSVANYKHRLLMMIDEFPSLGRLEIMQTALAYMAGYGIKAYLITQDVGQLAAAYGGSSGRDETIMANCHIQVAFAPNKLDTMELLSKMAGTSTVRSETKSYSGQRMAIRTQVMVNTQESERPLLTPDEVRRLPADDALIFVAGNAPIYGRRIKYYEDPTFAERARIAAPSGDGREPIDITPRPRVASHV
jgi:type IV secretion system protein VirD4